MPRKVKSEAGEERAEACQLQKAIDQSLLEKKPKPDMVLHKSFHECLQDAYPRLSASLYDNENIGCEKDTRKSSFESQKPTIDQTGFRFQCLLDVASAAVLGEDVCTYTSETNAYVKIWKENQARQCCTENLTTGEQMLGHRAHEKHNKYKDNSEVYCMEEDNGGNTHLFVEDDRSNCREGIGCFEKKLAKTKEESTAKSTGSAILFDQNKIEVEGKGNEFNIADSPESIFTATAMPAMKSVRPVRLAMAETCQQARLEANREFAGGVKDCGGKENIPTTSSPPLMTSILSRDWQASYPKERALAENVAQLRSFESRLNKGCQNICGPWKADKWQAFSSSSPSKEVVTKFPALLHRRVIGLSRRYRPPPLHPYLSGLI